MSGQFDNTNTGVLARNDRKTEDRHADFSGSLNVEGTDYFIDAYVRERKDGSGRFFSLRVKRKDKQQGSGSGGGRQQQDRGGPDLSDDIPF